MNVVKTSKEIISQLSTELYFSINTDDIDYMSLLIDAVEYQTKRIHEEENNEQLNYAHQIIVEWKKRENKTIYDYYYFILQLVDCLDV